MMWYKVQCKRKIILNVANFKKYLSVLNANIPGRREFWLLTLWNWT